MRQIQPSDSLMRSGQDQKIMRQLLVDRLKGKLRNGELARLLSELSLTEEYSLFKCRDQVATYQFIKSKIGVPRGVKVAMDKYPDDVLFPFDEVKAFYSSKERITL